MDPLPVIHVVQEPAELAVRIGELLALGQIDVLFFDRSNQAFGISVLLRPADRRDADRRAAPGEKVG
jgi:hypothetical protein